MCPFKSYRVRRALILTLSLVWFITTDSTAEDLTMASQDWPQWRGPERDGVSSETGLLTEWPAEGPREVWRIRGGSGYSTVAVVGGRAFTMFASGEAEFAVCLDVTSGKEIWRAGLGELLVDNDGADGPRATPTVDDDRVYVVSAMGRLYALDVATGVEHWHVDLREDYSASMPRYGYSGSPLVEGELLLIESGGAAGKSILALNKRTGEEVWSSQRDLMSYSSPIVFDAAGERHVVFFTAWAVLAISPEDGRSLWRHDWVGTDNMVTPIFIAPNRIFVSSWTGASVLEITGTGEKIAIQELWHKETLRNGYNSWVHHEGHLYGYHGSILKCVNVETGELAWQARGQGEGTLIMADGNLIILTVDGELVVAQASSDEYREIATAQVLEGSCLSSPTLAAGRLYLRNLTEIVCLDLAQKKGI